MPRYVVDLDIPADELARYYRGAANGVIARARSGERLRFPAHVLRRFVAHDGVSGTFALDVDPAYRLRGIHRLG